MFTKKQYLLLALNGIVFWFLAAILLRYLGPMGVYESTARIFLFVAIIPGSIPFVFFIRKVSGIEKSQMAAGISFATMTAMLCDGVALSWFPDLYGGLTYTSGAGATILWGAGVLIALGFIFNRD